jgi:hypothetical protein
MEVLFEKSDLADSQKRKGKYYHVSKQIEKRIEQLSIADNLDLLEKKTFIVEPSDNAQKKMRVKRKPINLPLQ